MTIQIPLFPLSAHLLPGGRLPLRIFEPRYVRMVKEACANNSGFGICMFNAQGDVSSNQHIFPIGTFAKVIDFDLLDDGMLGITVEGERAFTILNVSTEPDGLRTGQCDWLDNWSFPVDQQWPLILSEKLQEIFEKYPDLKNLYKSPKFENPIWVVYRWLELVPIEAKHKQRLLASKECDKALDYLTQLVE